MRLAERAIARPVTTAMVFVSLVTLGTVASRLLPLEMFPDMDRPLVMVQVPYEGATPQEVEERITRPLEESLATMSGIERMRSWSSSNDSRIRLEFDWGQDIPRRVVEAREKVEQVRDELPDDVERVLVRTFSTADEPVLTLRISSQRNLANAYDLLDRHLRRPVQRLPGVASVELQGVEPNEVRIELDSERLEAHGIEMLALRERLQSANFSVSAGDLVQGQRRLLVRADGGIHSLRALRELPINDGGLRLRDVADVTLGPGERDYGRHLHRRYAVGLEVYKERGANLVAVAERVLAEIERIGDSPTMQGIELFFLQNQAEGVVSSLNQLLRAGALGALFAMIVLYFFLRNMATTLMVTLAVPVSLTVALGCMYFLDISLNVLSMMGLMLAVGMLVDNAVVVSESIYRERERRPEQPAAAAGEGARQVAMPVAAGTLTTIIVFLPNIFGAQNNVSVYLYHVAVAICISLVASLIIAQTVIPACAARLKRVRSSRDSGRWIDRLRPGYGRVLAWALSHRWLMSAAIAGVVLSAAIPIRFVPVEMFPETGDRRLFLHYNLHTHYPLERVEKAVDHIEDYLYGNQERFEIRAVYSFFNESGTAQSTILLTDADEASKTAQAVRDAIRADLPKLAIGKPGFERQSRIGGEGVSIALRGPDSERLVTLTRDVARTLEAVPGIADVRSQAGAAERQLAVHINRERSARLGLPPERVAQTLALGVRGSPLQELRTEGRELPVRMMLAESDRNDLGRLQALPLRSASGTRARVGALAEMTQRDVPVSIQRVDRRTRLGIEANLDDITLSEARERIEAVMNQVQLPPGYDWTLGRAFQRSDEALLDMAINILLAVALVYLVMAALFESLLYPASIVSSILFSIIGVYWFFLMTGTAFSLMAMIGILILIGVVVNNGIVLIDHINRLRRDGMAREAAIVQAGQDRLRPILMTVATTVLGLVPLCVSQAQIGGDGPPYFPMARAIVGGLVFSTAISLVLLPAIYVMLDDLRRWARRLAAATRDRGNAAVTQPISF